MESPNKRLKVSPPVGEEADFVPLGGGEDEVTGDRFGFAAAEAADSSIASAPKGPKAQQGAGHFSRNAWNDPRNAKDRPKSKHIIPGHEPWILVRTKYRRRFAHNTQTKESLWRIPHDVFQAVRELERGEREQKEKERNAAWAEEQLREMQRSSKTEEVNRKADDEGRARRRRSESLQREDEEAMMAELVAEAERKEELDAKEAVEKVEEKERPWRGAYDSGGESDYEEVEVTDSEGEEGGEREEEGQDEDGQQEQQEDAPVEFGEDDIAYQLAAMGEEYGLDQGEYGSPGSQGEWDEGAEGLPISDEDATALFRDMLDDHRISPFTPWDKLIADESEDSILMDDWYTVLPNMRARKAAWEGWVKDAAARLHEERAKMEKKDPRIPYLAFVSEHATPKLYWPEFKRKYKKDAMMNDRKFSDKDREKLYREHISRLKLPESTRKADLINLLKSIPLRDLNKMTTQDTLPQQLLSHTHFISLPSSTRNNVITSHIASLPSPPSGEAEGGELTEAQRVEEERKRAEREKREKALAERERKVDEERRKAEKDGRWARRDLREEERELQRAMKVDRRNVMDGLREE